MNKYFGGEQNVMRESKIEDETYLGPFDHPHKLKVGDIQQMQYQPNDSGPFHLNKQKKEELKFDCQTSEIEIKKYTRAQLIDALKTRWNLSNVHGNFSEIQTIAKGHNLPIEYQRLKVVEGWNQNFKGMLQVLWERGFIDPSKSVRHYTKDGRKISKDSNKII